QTIVRLLRLDSSHPFCKPCRLSRLWNTSVRRVYSMRRHSDSSRQQHLEIRIRRNLTVRLRFGPTSLLSGGRAGTNGPESTDENDSLFIRIFGRDDGSV